MQKKALGLNCSLQFYDCRLISNTNYDLSLSFFFANKNVRVNLLICFRLQTSVTYGLKTLYTNTTGYFWSYWFKSWLNGCCVAANNM